MSLGWANKSLAALSCCVDLLSVSLQFFHFSVIQHSASPSPPLCLSSGSFGNGFCVRTAPFPLRSMIVCLPSLPFPLFPLYLFAISPFSAFTLLLLLICLVDWPTASSAVCEFFWSIGLIEESVCGLYILASFSNRVRVLRSVSFSFRCCLADLLLSQILPLHIDKSRSLPFSPVNPFNS